MKRRKFIITCAYCAMASCTAVLLSQRIPHIKNSQIPLVNIPIAQHCNLNCKYCFNFSCIAQKEFYDLDKFKQDMSRMSYIFKNDLPCINLSGGEPLLNPQINEYVKNLRKCFPQINLNIITNATLLDNMDESFWKTLNENNVNIIPSIYPIKINWKSILQKAEKYNVGIYMGPSYKIRVTLDNIEKHCKTKFHKITFNEENYNKLNKPQCGMVSECRYVYDGKFYPCAPVAFIRHLNKKFNTNFIVTNDDYLDLHKIKNKNEIENFLNKIRFPFCDYCFPGEMFKWEVTSEHSLSEWT